MTKLDLLIKVGFELWNDFIFPLLRVLNKNCVVALLHKLDFVPPPNAKHSGVDNVRERTLRVVSDRGPTGPTASYVT